MNGAMPLREYLASLKAAKPGDPAGGLLEGQRDQLQKLPAQGHGGEFVMNAEATRKFRPILEAMNRSVPAATGVKPETPSRGRSYYAGGDGVGSEGAGPAGSSASGDDTGVATDTATTADDPGDPFGVAPVDDPPVDEPPPVDDPTAKVTPYGLPTNKGGLRAAITAALNPSNSAKAASAIATAIAGPIGTVAAALGRAGIAAAENAIANRAAENAAITGFGVTPGGLAVAGHAIAGEVSGIQGAAATNGVSGGPASGGGQGGADEPSQAEWGWQPGEAPVALSDYLAWLRATTQPVRGLRQSIYG